MMKHLNKIIIGVLGLLVISCLAAMFIIMKQQPTDGQIATIKLDGQVIRQIDLSKVNEPETISIDNKRGGINTIHVEHGKIGIIEANCLDQLCVKQGYITNSLLPAVCLPNGVVIEITSTSDTPSLDAIVE